MLSDLQKSKIARMFQVVDADGNGYLEPGDLDRLAHNVATEHDWAPGSTQYEALRARYQMWVNASRPYMQNGRLDLTAYLAYHDALLNMPGAYDATVRGLTEFVFDAIDADGDGQATISELKQFYRAYGIPEATVDSAFHQMDTNRDGLISRVEVTRIVAQFYYSSNPALPGNSLFGRPAPLPQTGG